jgi:hypothetical protein
MKPIGIEAGTDQGGTTMGPLLGASWKTTLAGYGLACLIIAAETLKSGGIPTTKEGWIAYASAVFVAILGRVGKDGDVSHAAVPTLPRPIDTEVIQQTVAVTPKEPTL